MKTFFCTSVLLLCCQAMLGSARPLDVVKNDVDGDEAEEATKLRERPLYGLLYLDSAPSKHVASNSGSCTPSDRVVDNFKANGTAFWTTRCGSVSMCVQECLYRGPACVAVNYGGTKDYTCHLFSEIEGMYYSEGWQTALTVPDTEMCEDKYLLTGGWRNGRQSYGSPFTVSSATECCKTCTEIRSCVAFDYDTRRGHCYLRTHILQPKDVDTWTHYKNGVICKGFHT